MKMTQKNLLIGAGLVTVGLVLAYRAEKKGKKVPVIGGLFRKSSSTEDAEVLAEAELEEEGEADVVNFSNAAGMPDGYDIDCYNSSYGVRCCKNSKGETACDWSNRLTLSGQAKASRLPRTRKRAVSSVASVRAGGNKPKKGDCFKANTGETCCYTGQGLDLRCTRGAAEAMTAARRARRTRRG